MTDPEASSGERAGPVSLGSIKPDGRERNMTSVQTVTGNPLGGLLSLETAVLRAFCLAINTNRAATARRIA